MLQVFRSMSQLDASDAAVCEYWQLGREYLGSIDCEYSQYFGVLYSITLYVRRTGIVPVLQVFLCTILLCTACGTADTACSIPLVRPVLVLPVFAVFRLPTPLILPLWCSLYFDRQYWQLALVRVHVQQYRGDFFLSQIDVKIRPRKACNYPNTGGPVNIQAVSGGESVIRLSLGKLLVNLLQVIKRTNTPLIP